MSKVLSIIMANLPALIKGGTSVWQLVARIREAARQADAWTPEFEAQYQKQLTDANEAPESLTDAERGVAAEPTDPPAE